MSLFRLLHRSLRLLCALGRAAFRIEVLRVDPREAVHQVSREIVDILGVRLLVTGEVPEGGLIVCNHLGYLDVVALAATCPTLFVAKSEVGGWPAFGWFARRMGCIFAERGRPSSAGRTAEAIRTALGQGSRVVLFPEGTSSGGDGVLPFRSSLLQAGVGHQVTVAALSYGLEAGDGDPAREVCYWGDMTLIPHLVRLMTKKRVHARLAFGAFGAAAVGRKDLAVELRERVFRLRRNRASSGVPWKWNPPRGERAPVRERALV